MYAMHILSMKNLFNIEYVQEICVKLVLKKDFFSVVLLTFYSSKNHSFHKSEGLCDTED